MDAGTIARLAERGCNLLAAALPLSPGVKKRKRRGGGAGKSNQRKQSNPQITAAGTNSLAPGPGRRTGSSASNLYGEPEDAGARAWYLGRPGNVPADLHASGYQVEV